MRQFLWRGAIFVLTSGFTTQASAQFCDILGGVIGGVIAEAQAQATREAWERMPSSDRACHQRALVARGSNLVTVMRAGLMPVTFGYRLLPQIAAGSLKELCGRL